jgi:hypothetical protein
MRNGLIALFLVFMMIAVAGCGSAPASDSQPGQMPAKDGNSATQDGSVVGSGSSATDAPKTGGVEQNTATQKIGLDQIYKYGQLKSYEYRITSEGAEAVNMKYTISSDTVDGTAAWLQQSDISSQGANMVSKIWFSKVTYKCLKIETEINAGGQVINQPGQCPDETANTGSAEAGKMPEVTYEGKESVTVPAGTFNADKYSTEGTEYWVGGSTPLPVKVTSNNGKTMMELVSYS